MIRRRVRDPARSAPARARVAAASRARAARCSRGRLRGARGRATPPGATLVNASGAELTDVTFVGGRGPLAPSLARIAPATRRATRLGVQGEDAVFVSFVADGRACVSVDSAYVERRGGYEVRFVVDSTLTARVAGHPARALRPAAAARGLTPGARRTTPRSRGVASRWGVVAAPKARSNFEWSTT